MGNPEAEALPSGVGVGQTSPEAVTVGGSTSSTRPASVITQHILCCFSMSGPEIDS